MRLAIIQDDPNELLALRTSNTEMSLTFLSKASPVQDGETLGFIFSCDLSDTGWLEILKAHAEQGRPILGMGLGAKYLAEHGFVPGIANDAVGIRCQDGIGEQTAKHIRLSAEYQRNAYTHNLSPKSIYALGLKPELSFDIPPGLLAEMTMQGLNWMTYCDAVGQPELGLAAIAAVTNKAGNILAMIPNLVDTTLGTVILHSMQRYITSGEAGQVAPLHYLPR